MRLVIELKRDAIPKVVLNKLYKHTPMQTTFGVNMVALVDNVPRTLTLREVIHALRRPPARGDRPAHQVRARREKEARAHILEGLLIGARQPRRDHRADPRLARPRGRPRAAGRRASSSARSRRQAILDLRLCQLTALEADKIKQEHADVHRAHRRAARDPRRREPRRWPSSRTSCRRSPSAYGDERRTEITPRRGRDRHRGPDRRPADGDHDHPDAATSSRCRWPPTASSSAAGAA